MTHARFARIAAPYLAVPLLGTLTLAGGCKEETKIETLFDEGGVWSLIKYDTDGGGQESTLAAERENKFMLKFSPEEKVVQTASCIWPGDSADPEMTAPSNTPCGRANDLLDTEWSCQCFAYAFEEDRMRWVEFTAGDTPPEVTLDPQDMMAGDDAGGGGTGGGTGGDGTGDGGSGGDAGDDDGGGSGGDSGPGTSIIVNAVTGVAFTFFFRPLPLGVFTSNGTSSRFQMQARGNTVFNEVLDDPMRKSCQPCVPLLE